MTDLLGCPFCGGEAERVELTDEENFGGSVICCKKCGASSPVHFDRKENLTSSWNDRTHSLGETGGPADAVSEAEVDAMSVELFGNHMPGSNERCYINYRFEDIKPLLRRALEAAQRARK